MFKPHDQQSSPQHASAAVVVTCLLVEFACLSSCGRSSSTEKELPSPSGFVAQSVNEPTLLASPIRKEPVSELHGLAEIYHYKGSVGFPVLHVPIELFPPDPQALRKLLNFVPGKPGFVVDMPGNPWAKAGASASFNCHAFTFGEALGFTPNDQVNGADVKTLGYRNPVDQLLQAFYRKRCEYQVGAAGLVQFETDSDFNGGELVFLVQGSGAQTEYMHSGRVVKHDGENWVMSKLGEDPLVMTPMAVLTNLYAGSFSRVEVWLPK